MLHASFKYHLADAGAGRDHRIDVLFDFNDDGFLDLFVTCTARWTSDRYDPAFHYHPGLDDLRLMAASKKEENVLYRNNGDGTFTDVTARASLTGTGWGGDVAAFDYDEDGYLDLLVTNMFGRSQLYRNNGDGTFIDTTAEALGPTSWGAIGCKAFDYNNDGKLDLFLGGYYPEDVNLWHLKTTKMMPESFEYAQNGGRKYLFHNLGNGRFEEVSEKLGINSRRWALAAVAADLRDTGYPDLFIANDYGVSELYFNDGNRFHEVGEQTGVGFAPKSGMNASVGDILNQGRYAVYVSNISEDGVLIQGNNLWMPKEKTSGDKLQFENLARDFGVELGGWSFGAQFGDLNNDGTLDLYLTNGYVSLDHDRSYWYDFSKIAGGHSAIINDASDVRASTQIWELVCVVELIGPCTV